jgi:hypothetical protein
MFPGGASKSGIEVAAIITAQGAGQWIRTDGSAVTAAVTGGLKLNVGDFRILEGRVQLSALRVIHDTTGGALAVEYYVYRSAPGARF